MLTYQDQRMIQVNNITARSVLPGSDYLIIMIRNEYLIPHIIDQKLEVLFVCEENHSTESVH